MKIGFTGTRRGMTEKQLDSFRRLLLHIQLPWIDEFHHGDCIGADTDAHKVVSNLNRATRIIIHPPSNDKLRAFNNGDDYDIPQEYLARNRCIVADTDVLIACPGEMEEQARSGTWSTIRYARKLHRSVTIVFPDGTVTRNDSGLF